MNLEAAYLNDIVDVWFQGLSRRRTELSWPEFVEDFCMQFGERNMMDVIE